MMEALKHIGVDWRDIKMILMREAGQSENDVKSRISGEECDE
jgi:hypothetical protein